MISKIKDQDFGLRFLTDVSFGKLISKHDFGKGNELTHIGVQNVVAGLCFVPQLTFLDLRSLLTCMF